MSAYPNYGRTHVDQPSIADFVEGYMAAERQKVKDAATVAAATILTAAAVSAYKNGRRRR